jgi:iron(III) transport system substrate-binding protein
MSAAGPSQGANSSPSGGSAAAKAASVGVQIACIRRWARVAAFAFAAGTVVAGLGTASAGPLVIYCTHDPDACELAAQTFTRDSGTAVAMTRKATGEVYAQLRAERDNPKADIWYGGTFDSFLQGAEEGLFAPYRSPRLQDLHPWAQRQAQATGDRAVAIYRIIIGFGINPAILAKRNLAAPLCWSDLTRPEYRKEVELSNPVTSGTGYTILATLVALYGEDGAFDYLKRLDPNVVRYTQSGTAQGPSVARGEVGIGVSFVHEFITQQLAGFPVDIGIPCEGTGDALGGMAIVAGGPNPVEARAFYDWALTKGAQELANHTRNLLLPAHRAAEIRPEAARYASVKVVDIDTAKFGAPAVKKRLLARWQSEIGSALR